MFSKLQWEFITIQRNHITKVFAKLFLNILFVSFNCMLDDYKKKKTTREKHINTIFVCILLLIMLGVGFAAYSFYQRISDNKQYTIGSGNRYVNIIQNTLYGEKVDGEEDTPTNLERIQDKNEDIIKSSIESLKTQRISEEDSFLNRFQIVTGMELKADSNVIDPESIPCFVFTAFSNPVFHFYFI